MSGLEIFWQPRWVERVGWTLLHFLWQGTLIAVLYAAVRALLGRSLNPRARYALACLALAAMTATPPLTLLAAGNMAAGPLPMPVWRVSGMMWERVLPWIVIAWFAGALVFSARLLGSWRFSARLRSMAAGPVPREWQRVLEELMVRMRASAPVGLSVSALISAPSVVGWLRPVILMPIGAVAGLPMEQVQALLAHELAHIRRHDYLANILQSIAEAVLFYHPAVWWVSEQIRTERELCCDDLAVEACGDVLVYARALADLDIRRRARFNAILAADGGSLVSRIRRLVGEPEPASTSLPGPGVALAFSLLWMAGMGAAALHGAPAVSGHTALRPFVAPRMSAPAPILLAPPPRLPVSAAVLLFDPFFAAPQTPPSPQKPRVEGTVLDSNGNPVKKAAVHLQMLGSGPTQRATAYWETSDDGGKFVIDDIQPGRYTLAATKAGFVGGKYGARSAYAPGALVTVADGAAVKALDIKLTPHAEVRGRVVDRYSGLAVHASVGLLRLHYAGGAGNSQTERPATTVTDSQGRFSLSMVPPGRYYLHVMPTYTPRWSEGYLPTYYPSALDEQGAVALDVPAGGRLDGIEVKVRDGRVYTVTGTATLNGEPIHSTMLNVQSTSGVNSASLIFVRNGSFQIDNLAPGTYTLRTVPQGTFGGVVAETQGLSGAVDVTVKDKNLDGVILPFEPGIAPRGIFKLEDGDWASLFSTGAATASSALSVAKPTVGLAPVDGTPLLSVRPNDDGTFQLYSVGRGRFVWNVAGLPQGLYVKSVHYGSTDVTHSPLNLSGADSLEIVVSKKAAAISGALHNDDGSAMTGVLVTVWPKNLNPGVAGGGIQSAYTDQNGAFQFGNLEPGEYRAAAWEELDNGLDTNPEFLEAFTSQAAELKLTESAQISIDVKIVPRDKIAAAAARLR